MISWIRSLFTRVPATSSDEIRALARTTGAQAGVDAYLRRFEAQRGGEVAAIRSVPLDLIAEAALRRSHGRFDAVFADAVVDLAVRHAPARR